MRASRCCAQSEEVERSVLAAAKVEASFVEVETTTLNDRNSIVQIDHNCNVEFLA